MSRIAYPRTYNRSEGSLESVICHASEDESTTQKQPWSKKEIEIKYENISMSRIAYPRTFSSSEGSLESVIYHSSHSSQDESMTQKQSCSKKEIEVEYENIPMSRIAYPQTYISSSEGSLESVICHASEDELTTQKQPWSKEEIKVALSKLPGGDIALSLIPTLHGRALQKILEEFQRVTINKNEDRKHHISLPTDEIKEKTILVDKNRAAASTTPVTPIQLLAEWPDTCLLISSWLGHVEIIKALLDKGVSVDTSDNDGRTPLHLAACTTSTKIVKKLLKHGADPCKWDFEKKCTPLHCAAAAGCVATVKCLIKSGADVDARRSPLYYAVLNNAVDCVATLLQAGACPDNPQVYTKMPLHVAASLGNVRCMKLLLDHGANVTMKMGITKSTPLHLAAEKGNAECARLLLGAGAKTETKNSNGQTAMHLATLAQSVETIMELIRFGAKVNAEDNKIRTPLHVAVASARKSSELVKTLIQAGASINKADKCGYTPLHIAALNGSSRMATILLSEGGDVTARTKDGETALSFIVDRTPEVLSQLVMRLDQAVSLHDHELGNVNCKLRLDFQLLLSGGRSETDLMLCLVEVGESHMLKHPLCESFLHLKWKRIRKFFMLSLLFHLIFVALFTGFVYATYLWHNESLSRIFFWPVLIITCLFASKEIFQITYDIYYYTKRWENWLQWSVIVASSIILIPPWSRPWQRHGAVLGILLVWIELMIVIGYFPMFGLYVQMFKRVSINFFKYLTAYICLLIGFCLSFNVLHDDYKSFADPLLSMLKIIIMMSGELEFEDIFFQKDKDTDKDVPLAYPGTAHVILLCFVILVTVILMNLMVGMAVSDIQELRRCAGFERLVRHAEVIARFENMLFSKLLDYTHACKIIKACRETTLLLHPLAHYALHIRPNDPREKRLPRQLIQSLYRLASKQKMRRGTFRNNTSPPGNITANKLNHAKFSNIYNNDSNQQQLDELVAELKKCSYDVSELKECFHDVAELKKCSHDIFLRLDSLTNKIKSIVRDADLTMHL